MHMLFLTIGHTSQSLDCVATKNLRAVCDESSHNTTCPYEYSLNSISEFYNHFQSISKTIHARCLFIYGKLGRTKILVPAKVTD